MTPEAVDVKVLSATDRLAKVTNGILYQMSQLADAARQQQLSYNEWKHRLAALQAVEKIAWEDVNFCCTLGDPTNLDPYGFVLVPPSPTSPEYEAYLNAIRVAVESKRAISEFIERYTYYPDEHSKPNRSRRASRRQEREPVQHEPAILAALRKHVGERYNRRGLLAMLREEGVSGDDQAIIAAANALGKSGTIKHAPAGKGRSAAAYYVEVDRQDEPFSGDGGDEA